MFYVLFVYLFLFLCESLIVLSHFNSLYSGIGLMLFVDTMNIIQPDLVIQIESNLQYNNFPAVTRDLVALDEGWTFNKLPVLTIDLLFPLPHNSFPKIVSFHSSFPKTLPQTPLPNPLPLFFAPSNDPNKCNSFQFKRDVFLPP